MSTRPIYSQVTGSPFQPGDLVRVVDSIDEDVAPHGVPVGKLGLAKYLEYECGCGQSFPEYPMVGVRFSDKTLQVFWPEELEVVRLSASRSR